MPNFTAGTSFTDGVTNDVTAAKLNALIADAVPTSSLSLNSTTGTISQFSSGTGTAASPAIQPTGDTNTGIFFPAADTIAFSDGGTEAMRIDSSGNVGIGASSPSQKLDVNGGSAIRGTIFIGDGSSSVIRKLTANTPLNFANSGGSTEMTIDSSGNVGIGITSPANRLHIIGTTAQTQSVSIGAGGNAPVQIALENGYGARQGIVFQNTGSASYPSFGIISENTALAIKTASYNIGSTSDLNTNWTERLRIDSSGNVGIGVTSPAVKLDVSNGNIQGKEILLQNGAASSPALGTTPSWYSPASGVAALSTNAFERLRITSDGNFLVGKTQSSTLVVGAWINTNGKGIFTSDADAPLAINRLTNDGGLVEFFQASTLEGTISVSGTTVSYNGGHLSRYSQLQSGQRDLSIKKGTILSNLDEMCVWNDAEGNPLPNEQLNKVKISDVEGDSNVAGVFVNWDNDDQDNPFDLNMAMTGDMIIRIAQGVSVSRGDLLMSAGDGTAKPQGDDICKSKTIAKVTSANVTCTYEDGSYCVPCVLMAC